MKLLTNLLIWAVIFVITYLTLDYFSAGAYTTRFAIVLTLLAVAVLVPFSSITVQAKQIKVTQNYFFKKVDEGLKAYASGFWWKQLWEGVPFVIDLRREVLVTTRQDDMGLTGVADQGVAKVTVKFLPTKDGIVLGAAFVFRFAVHPPLVLNYIKFREAAIVETLVTRAVQFFSDAIAKRNYADLIAEKADLTLKATEIFDGKKRSAIEDEMGITVSDPELSDFILHPDAIQALLVLKKNSLVTDAVRAMFDAHVAMTNSPETFNVDAARKRVETVGGYRTEAGYDITVAGLENLTHANIVVTPPKKTGP